jgi:ABC-type branched-subunit amino acid transport system substrate-binding protein
MGRWPRGRCAPVFLLALLAAAQLHAAEPLTLADADFIASSPEGRAHARALRDWIRGASLSELMYVLRRPGEALRGHEARLVEAALGRVSAERADLRRTLRLRLALADPRRARDVLGEVGRDPGALTDRARASVFTVAVLLPSAGPYTAFAEALRAGIDAGLAFENARGTIPVTARHWDTGDDDPARSAAVLDSASRESAVVIGELLSVPTLALASGARAMRLPLVSPTATDEAVGRAGRTVFQVGPSAYHRGATLARGVLAGGALRIAALVASDRADRPFQAGFTQAIESGGGRIAWRDAYAPGNRDFRAAVKRLGIENADRVFFDGDPDEAAALLREIQRQKLSVRLCGAEALSPEHQHDATSALLEGARFVADDWVLQPALGAPLDSLLALRGIEGANEIHMRGFLAARLIAAAVRGRALCAEEITASLLTRVRGEPYLVERGFLDWGAEGAALRVYEVEKGRARPIATK